MNSVALLSPDMFGVSILATQASREAGAGNEANDANDFATAAADTEDSAKAYVGSAQAAVNIDDKSDAATLYDKAGYNAGTAADEQEALSAQKYASGDTAGGASAHSAAMQDTWQAVSALAVGAQQAGGSGTQNGKAMLQELHDALDQLRQLGAANPNQPYNPNSDSASDWTTQFKATGDGDKF